MELTLDQALQKGIKAHKKGQAKEADSLYTAILKSQPKHPDANHNMGVLAVGLGKVQEALPFFKTALEASPSAAQYWLSYINALMKLNRSIDAKEVFDQAKEHGAKGSAFDKLEQTLISLNEVKIEAASISQRAEHRQSNILDNLKIAQALRLAKKKSKEASAEEAKQIYTDILIRFPKNKKAIDGLKALSSTVHGKTLKVRDASQDQLQVLVNLYSQDKFREALKQTNELIQQFPQSSSIYNIKGAILAGLGQFDAAIKAYDKALKIKPAYAEVYNNMGVSLQCLGQLENALAAYKKALEIKHYYSEAYNNMGFVLQKLGQLKEAIEAFNQALRINPLYAEAFNNMGIALHEQGKMEKSIEAYCRAISLKPNYTGAYSNIGHAIKKVKFSEGNLGLQEIINLILSRYHYVKPKDISEAAISLLKFEPSIKDLFQQNSAVGLTKSLLSTITDASNVPLLLKLMSTCPIDDLELETGLADVRSKLLYDNSKFKASSSVLLFQSALALQCFTNEYIYGRSEAEANALIKVEASVKKQFSMGNQPCSQSILCLASYKALSEYEWHRSLEVNTEIEEVFIRQILEPKTENQLKHKMPILKKITNKISHKVKTQYEQKPYPRWVNPALCFAPITIKDLIFEIELKIFSSKINRIKAPKILVAGCGTGQHSIATATRFKNSNVLAIDLSLSSLAYAQRKTDEISLQNIEYMQADILDLNKFDRQFDIIESSGVLHHMNDPMAGWRVLTDCLKKGGLMKIGLYSELARQDIVKLRKEIKQSGKGSSDDVMRSFRDRIIGSDKEHHKQILISSDFYSLSTLKDLLFHVQEHRFTIPQIKKCLAELGLKFCGFEAESIMLDFKLENTGADDPYNLDKWNDYEQANPNIFRGMYQFWCQKAD